MNLNAEGLRFNRDTGKESLVLSSLEGETSTGQIPRLKSAKKPEKAVPCKIHAYFA